MDQRQTGGGVAAAADEDVEGLCGSNEDGVRGTAHARCFGGKVRVQRRDSRQKDAEDAAVRNKVWTKTYAYIYGRS